MEDTSTTITSIKEPELQIVNDYDGVFEARVRCAIALNIKNNKPMVEKVKVDSGPYRPYCFKYRANKEVCNLDFYAANRNFGFEHTIEDIAEAISSTGIQNDETRTIS